MAGVLLTDCLSRSALTSACGPIASGAWRFSIGTHQSAQGYSAMNYVVVRVSTGGQVCAPRLLRPSG
jgi:hypothetical protein